MFLPPDDVRKAQELSSAECSAGVIKTVGHAPGLYGVRRRASLAAALHIAVADTFNRTRALLSVQGSVLTRVSLSSQGVPGERAGVGNGALKLSLAFRNSGFGLPSAFGFRASDFLTSPSDKSDPAKGTRRLALTSRQLVKKRYLDDGFIAHRTRRYRLTIALYVVAILLFLWQGNFGLLLYIGLTLMYLLPSRAPMFNCPS